MALLALEQALARANSILNGPRTSTTLEIRATRGGSFDVALEFKQVFDSATQVFSGDFFSSAANLKELFRVPAVLLAEEESGYSLLSNG